LSHTVSKYIGDDFSLVHLHQESIFLIYSLFLSAHFHIHVCILFLSYTFVSGILNLLFIYFAPFAWWNSSIFVLF
jgi:hypothetical protein